MESKSQKVGINYQSTNYQELIKKRAQELKEEHNLNAITVFTDIYKGKRLVAYFSKPKRIETYDKFISMASTSGGVTMANRQLLSDCFLEGDIELIENETIFCELGVFKTANDLASSYTSEVITF